MTCQIPATEEMTLAYIRKSQKFRADGGTSYAK